jgi:hypothetical protein
MNDHVSMFRQYYIVGNVCVPLLVTEEVIFYPNRPILRHCKDTLPDSINEVARRDGSDIVSVIYIQRNEWMLIKCTGSDSKQSVVRLPTFPVETETNINLYGASVKKNLPMSG